MVALRNADSIIDDLDRLASCLAGLDLRSADSSGEALESGRDRLVRTIRSYLIPRLTEPDRPMTVVFAGPTGSGKSTLINSISGLDVSRTGPLRPTTSTPVVLSSGAWENQFEYLGGLDCHVVTGSAPILEKMAFVDTPDIDSTSTEHRVAAETLIDHADVVVFVTSALRYADLVPWEVLRRALSRGAPVINVLNRVGTDSAGAVVDFRRRLDDSGIAGELIRVPEHHLVSGDGAVPSIAVHDLRRRLFGLMESKIADDRAISDRVLRTTLEEAGSLADSIDEDVSLVGEAVQRALSAFTTTDLDLASAAGEMRIEGPLPATRWGRRRWLRRNRLSDQRLAGYLESVHGRMRVVITTDIRRRLAEGPSVEAGPSLFEEYRDAGDIFDIAFADWKSGIELLARDVDRRNRNLAVQTLMAAALDGGNEVAETLLFGIERDRLVGLARAGLQSALGVVYAHVGHRVARRVSDRRATAETEDLRQRTASTAVSAHFTHA